MQTNTVEKNTHVRPQREWASVRGTVAGEKNGKITMYEREQKSFARSDCRSSRRVVAVASNHKQKKRALSHTLACVVFFLHICIVHTHILAICSTDWLDYICEYSTG